MCESESTGDRERSRMPIVVDDREPSYMGWVIEHF
jgi:hypothetical protein